MNPIQRIHHISATVADPNENLHFYRDILGLRLVKQTINFENKKMYHLYFANQQVDKGSIITFFPYTENPTGRVGAGQARHIAFKVPKNTLSQWKIHLTRYSVSYSEDTLFQKPALLFHDPHHLHLALVETEETKDDYQIIGLHGIELLSVDPTSTLKFLVQEMGLLLNKVTSSYYHLGMVGEEEQEVLINRTITKKGQLGMGTIHHVAWSVAHKENLKEWKETIAVKRKITNIENRKYFYSAYFKDPGQIIYELATEGPGFTVDESYDALGSSLKLPERYEEVREEIEKDLPKLKL